MEKDSWKEGYAQADTTFYQAGDYPAEQYNYDDYLDMLAAESQFQNLSDWQWEQISEYNYDGQHCMLNFWNTPYPDGKITFYFCILP